MESGKYADYVNEIHVSHKLGYPAYRIAPEGSPTFVFTYENKVFYLGAHQQHIYELTPKVITKTLYLSYWKEGSCSSVGIAALNIGVAGPIGPHGPKGVTGDIGPSGGARVKGDRGGVGPSGPK